MRSTLCEDMLVKMTVLTMIKSYRELSRLETFEERIEYLYIGDKIGRETFGQSRYINQKLYTSKEWKRVRDSVISRDNGCDLGIDGCGLNAKNIIIHHITPITEKDILDRNPCLFDLDNLISVSLQSHNYIHYGSKIESLPMDRRMNDTCPWRK